MELFALALKIKSDAQAMVRSLVDIDSAGKKAASTLDGVSAAVKKQDAAMRQLIESGEFYKDSLRQSYTNELKRQGLWERFLVIEKQVKDEINAVTRAQTQQNQVVNQSAASSTHASSGITKMTTTASVLASQIAGLNPQVGRLSSLLGEYAVGAGVTVGVLGGVAAISFAFKGAIATWRDAGKASDDLIGSLAAQTKALRDSGDAAAQSSLKFAQANLARVRASQASGGATASGLIAGLGSALGGTGFGAFIATGEAAKNALKLQKALDAVTAAERAVGEAADDMREKRMASDRAMAEFNAGAAEIFKRIDDQNKQAAEEAKRRLDERIKILSEAMVFDDLRARASKELTQLENSLSSAIAAGNVPLARRVELEERLARVRAGLATPAVSPLPTSPTVSITSMGAGGFEGFQSPMKALPGSVIPKLPPLINETGRVAVDAMKGLEADLAAATAGIAQTLGDGIYNAFAAAFSGEGIGGIFAAFGKTVLAGIGQIFTMMGQAYLQYGIIMSGLVPTLSNPFTAGPTAIAIGALLTALGAALGAIGKGSGRGTAAAGAFREPSVTNDVMRIKFVGRDGSSRDMVPTPSQQFVFVGANDPKLQREFGEIGRKFAQRRG